MTRRQKPAAWLWPAAAIAVAVAALWLLTRHDEQAGKNHKGGPAQSVAVASVDRGDIRVFDEGLGTVTPITTVDVHTQISGLLTKVAFQEGQIVKKGDFLLQIDPRPYQVALEQAEGALLRDQAMLKEAKLDQARYHQLLKQNSIARQTVDQQDALVLQDEGNVRTDQGQIDSAKLNLIYCHITAPVTGRVGLRQIDHGNFVQASDTTNLVVITQLQPISVIFTLPEDDLSLIQSQPGGQDGRPAPLPVQVWDRSDTHQIATGTLETTDNQIDTTTGTVKLRAIFANPDDRLFPNQFVNAKLLVQTDHNVLRIPTAALQNGEPGNFVYVVNAGDTVSVRPVKIGPQDGDKVEILSGVTAGESVVIDGADRLRDGAKVTVPAAKPAVKGQSASHHHHAAMP